jgi:hypothetical protein
MRVLICALMLAACACDEIKEPARDWRRPMKYCIDKCLSATFVDFHHAGSSWGTGSSSMNGLSQEKIFDRVLGYCKEFYEGETCCQHNGKYGADDNIVSRGTHHYDFGACVTSQHGAK